MGIEKNNISILLIILTTMNIVYIKIEYCKSNIKIFNKKLKYRRYIDKCNQFCNSINPLYCNNCLLKVLSDYNLNYYFSDYILHNDNDFYHVLRNSINFNQNIYNNYYNDYYENINYQENENYFHHMHNNTLHYIDINEYDSKNHYTEESNYNFDNSTIKSNTLSEITLDKSLKNLNKEENNYLKDDEEISLNNNFDIKNKEISLNTDKNNNENSNFNNYYEINNEKTNNNDKEINNNYEENNTDKNNLNSYIENKEILS